MDQSDDTEKLPAAEPAEEAAAEADPVQLPAAAAEPAPAPDIAALVDEWWRDVMPGSVLGRYTEAWNHVMGAVDELKRRLSAAQKGA